MEEDIKIIKNHYVFTTNHVLDDENKRFKQAIENLINKNKELEKMVELMAKDIAKNDIDEDICRKVKNKTSEKDDCYGDDYDMCKDCVIEFYKKKASEENG